MHEEGVGGNGWSARVRISERFRIRAPKEGRAKKKAIQTRKVKDDGMAWHGMAWHGMA